MADPFESFSGGFGDLIDGLETLFGSETRQNTSTTGKATSEGFAEANISGENRDRLEISDEAIDKIVSDILSGPEGLASIFGGEQNAGIFDSSVAAQAAGDLTAKITGEIAKLRAERVQTEDRTQTQTESQTQTQEQDSVTKKRKKGLIAKIFGI